MTMPRRRVVHVLVTREEAEKMIYDRHPQMRRSKHKRSTKQPSPHAQEA
jgi:hypothetical protein